MAIIAVGTAGLRRAGNRDAVLAAVRAATGVVIRVISGEEEARLAFLATTAALGLGDEPIVVFDTGGGSSQFTFGHGAAVEERFSVDVGAVLIRSGSGSTRRSVRTSSAPRARRSPRTCHASTGARRRLRSSAWAVASRTSPPSSTGSRSTTRTSSTAPSSTRDEIDRQIELYRSQDADGRRSIVGLQPARAEVILAGACIVRTILDKLGRESLVVSDRGLRHGVLAERFGA